MTTQNLKLDLNPGGAPKVVRVSQYDNDSRNLLINLVNGDKGAFTIPAGVAVSVNGTKPSGKGFSDVCTVSSDQVTVVIKDTMTDEPGRVRCELVLTKDSARLGSAKFELDVERGALSPVAIIESDTFEGIIKEAVRECANEQLIELTVDMEPSNESDNPVANKVVSNLFAGALKGLVCGSEVTADDISPVVHNLKVNAHGKNLLPYPYVGVFGNVNGAKLTDNRDGTITVSGTPSENYAFVVLQRNVALKDGVTYFVSTETKSTAFLLAYKDKTGKTHYICNDSITWSDEYTFVQAYLQYPVGQTVDEVVKPYIAVSNTATDYEPWVDPTTFRVTAGGKTFTPDSSGNVEGLTSDMLAGGISVNNGGIVDCEYNRDLTKAIAKIEAALFN